MLQKLKNYGLAAALACSSFAMATTAEARDRWNDGRGDGAAIAIGAGIVGLAVGALLADRDDGRYYDRRYYNNRRYVRVRGYPGHYYYYDGYPNRYYRDRYYDRYYGRSGNRWNRGYDRVDRYYDNRRSYRGYDRRDWRDDRRNSRRDWRNDRRDDRRDYRRRWGD